MGTVLLGNFQSKDLMLLLQLLLLMLLVLLVLLLLVVVVVLLLFPRDTFRQLCAASVAVCYVVFSF